MKLACPHFGEILLYACPQERIDGLRKADIAQNGTHVEPRASDCQYPLSVHHRCIDKRLGQFGAGSCAEALGDTPYPNQVMRKLQHLLGRRSTADNGKLPVNCNRVEAYRDRLLIALPQQFSECDSDRSLSDCGGSEECDHRVRRHRPSIACGAFRSV